MSDQSTAVCAKRGLAKWCNEKNIKSVQLRSQAAGNFRTNEFKGDIVNMCAECRKSNIGAFKIVGPAVGVS